MNRQLVRVAAVACAVLLATIYLTRGPSRAGPAPSAPRARSAALSAFLALHGSDYGCAGAVERLRRTDFPHMGDDVYLDYTGAGVYRHSQIARVMADLDTHLYGNAHSPSSCSQMTENKLQKAREAVARWFGTTTDKYIVVFTSGATAAIKLVGESFPFAAGPRSSSPSYVHLLQNHNSVLGIREYAKAAGAAWRAVRESEVPDALEEAAGDGQQTPLLFAYPLESNFDGSLYPLEWIHLAHSTSKRWKVLVDAAAYVPTHPLNLTEYPGDFVVMSFYKMFGYPTGLGALLIRADAFPMLRRPYWGGGQVLASLGDKDFHVMSKIAHEHFEAGTVSFLSILHVEIGLEALSQVGGMQCIARHTNSLTQYMASSFKALRHRNGNPVCVLYGKHDSGPDAQGAIVTINLLEPDGTYVSVIKALELAKSRNFHIRTGCMCNPGACYDALQMKNDDVIELAKLKENMCVTEEMIGDRPAGAIRISLGYATTFSDVDSFVDFVSTTYLKKYLNLTGATVVGSQA
eukprot:m51a1_g3215 putative molybdenum cofactor sulfurase (519) ;mRNA; r:38686-42660